MYLYYPESETDDGETLDGENNDGVSYEIGLEQEVVCPPHSSRPWILFQKVKFTGLTQNSQVDPAV